MKTLIAAAVLLMAAEAFAIPGCLTNLDIYCTGNNQTSVSTNGSSSAPTNEVHGMILLNPTGDQSGVYINFYSTGCSPADEVVAVIVYSCSDNFCGFGGRCAAGSHELNITMPAGCDIVSGYISMRYGDCCAVTWNPHSCHPCTVEP
jgi:hypothetical protein